MARHQQEGPLPFARKYIDHQDGLARRQQEGLAPFASKYIDHQDGLARRQQEGLAPFVSKYIDHQEGRWLVTNRRVPSLLLVSILTIRRGDGSSPTGGSCLFC
jgi:hypothetical protein